MAANSEESSRGLDVMGTFNRLREAYFRYYDTPFRLDDPRLLKERRDLFDHDNGAYRLPLVELRPEYVSAPRTLLESVREAGASPDLAAFAQCGLIPPGRTLYMHQEKALRAGMTPGQNMIVTAGTGSGKTESFLLPVLASLLQESESWTGAPASHRAGRRQRWARNPAGNPAVRDPDRSTSRPAVSAPAAPCWSRGCRRPPAGR